MRAALLFCAAAMAVAATSCSALLDFNSLVGPADGGSEGGGPVTEGGAGGADGGSSLTDGAADGATAAPDQHAGPNLLANGTFETGCDHWSGFQGTIAPDPTARTGKQSCRVCTLSTTTDYYTGGDQFTGGPPTIGATYHAQAWVRRAPGAASALAADIHLRMSNATPAFMDVEGTSSSGTTLSDSWALVETSFKSTMAAQQMDVFIASAFIPNACFLIDDVWLEKLP